MKVDILSKEADSCDPAQSRRRDASGQAVLIEIWSRTMGTRATMDCPCGFSELVEYGHGRAVGAVSVFPHFCFKCGLVSASIDSQEAVCPKCGSHEVIMYGERQVAPSATSNANCDYDSSENWIHDARVTRPRGDSVFDWLDCRITIGWHLCPSCKKFEMLTGTRLRISFD